MESVVMLPKSALDAATQIIDTAEEKRVRLRLLGGLAFKKLCPSAGEPPYFRENKDIDLMGRRNDSKSIVNVMETLGYKPRELFNKLNMGQRMIYYDMMNRRRVDLFLDEFIMCHKFNFRDSLFPKAYTLPITDLVMTKLQVVEMTDKEHRDLLAAFHDFELGESGIDGKRIAGTCAKDWGLYTTFRKSLAALGGRALTLEDEDRAIVVPRIVKLVSLMDLAPKSFGWKVRARVGEKARWYELPQSDSDAIFA